AAVGFEEPFQEDDGAPVRSALEVDQGPVDGDLGQAGQRAQGDLFDAGLGGGSQRHRIAVTTQSGVDPQHVDQGLFRFDCSLSGHVSQLSGVRAENPCGTGVDLRPTCMPVDPGLLPAECLVNGSWTDAPISVEAATRRTRTRTIATRCDPPSFAATGAVSTGGDQPVPSTCRRKSNWSDFT